MFNCVWYGHVTSKCVLKVYFCLEATFSPVLGRLVVGPHCARRPTVSGEEAPEVDRVNAQPRGAPLGLRSPGLGSSCLPYMGVKDCQALEKPAETDCSGKSNQSFSETCSSERPKSGGYCWVPGLQKQSSGLCWADEASGRCFQGAGRGAGWHGVPGGGRADPTPPSRCGCGFPPGEHHPIATRTWVFASCRASAPVRLTRSPSCSPSSTQFRANYCFCFRAFARERQRRKNVQIAEKLHYH